jgi:hypothetical protein
MRLPSGLGGATPLAFGITDVRTIQRTSRSSSLPDENTMTRRRLIRNGRVLMTDSHGWVRRTNSLDLNDR